MSASNRPRNTIITLGDMTCGGQPEEEGYPTMIVSGIAGTARQVA